MTTGPESKAFHQRAGQQASAVGWIVLLGGLVGGLVLILRGPAILGGVVMTVGVAAGGWWLRSLWQRA